MCAPVLFCPLCDFASTPRFAEIGGQRFFRCERCRLIFLDPEHHPSFVASRAHYDKHENDPADQRYRAFLNKLAAPLIERLNPGSNGLDYGSGPGPTLSVMLQEQGFPTAIYDPHYATDRSVLDQTYDFITCTETAEHFAHPAIEFERFHQMLRPKGWLGVMTQLRDDQRPFATWRYIYDPTHLCFYHPETMSWIARRFGWRLETPQESVSLFQKG